MPKICDNTSVGQIILQDDAMVMIERKNYPQAFAVPAGHVDGDENFEGAAEREAEEEVGIRILENKLVFEGDLPNVCKRVNGDHHFWKVFEAQAFGGDMRAGSDAATARWVSRAELQKMAARTEYFMKKYGIPYTDVRGLTVAIFGANPTLKQTDPEWVKEMGLEPVWYYILKKTDHI